MMLIYGMVCFTFLAAIEANGAENEDEQIQLIAEKKAAFCNAKITEVEESWFTCKQTKVSVSTSSLIHYNRAGSDQYPSQAL